MEALIAATPGLAVPGFGADAASANFADWPFTYDELEPFYVEAEQLYGVQGDAGDNPFASPRSRPYPDAARRADVPRRSLLAERRARPRASSAQPLHPHTYPAAINSRFYRRRPPAVRRLRPVQRLRLPEQREGLAGRDDAAPGAPHRPLPAPLQRHGDAARERRRPRDGRRVRRRRRQPPHARPPTPSCSPRARSSRRASASSRDPTAALGNSSGQVGRNLMFHLQTNVNGFLPAARARRSAGAP